MKTDVVLAIACAACLSSCTLSRSIAYWQPDIDDHKIFHTVDMQPSPGHSFSTKPLPNRNGRCSTL